MAAIDLEPCAGLANRLRVVISGICGAEDLERPLRIIWTQEPGVFLGDFKELFDLPASKLPRWVSILHGGYAHPKPYSCLSPADWALQASRNPVDPIIIKSYGHFHQSDPARWQRWLQRLKPQARFVAKLDAIFKGSKPVGVHIRRGDNRHSIEQSPTDAFEAAMDAYGQDTKFFVASDNAAEKARLMARYPGRILVAATILSRGSQEGGQQAFLDFLGLARCSEVLGSATSSFSEIAALYGGCPLRVIRQVNPNM
jgi:hypothetical protein